MRYKISLGLLLCLFSSYCGNRNAELKKNVSLKVEQNPTIKKDQTTKSKDDQPITFLEHWSWENETSNFWLELSQSGDSIREKYCSVTPNGNRIDCSDDTLTNYLYGIKAGNSFLVTFNSAFDDQEKRDTALLIYNHKHKRLTWVRKTNNIISFVPDSVVLR